MNGSFPFTVSTISLLGNGVPTNATRLQAGRETAEAALLKGSTKLRAVTSWSSHVPPTPSGSRAPTKLSLRSGLVPSTPKPGYPGVPVRTLGPGSRVAPPRAAAPPAFGRRGGGWGVGVRLQETARSQLGAPTSSTRRDGPADSASPPGRPRRPPQQAQPRSEPQTYLLGRGGQIRRHRKELQRPWGPWLGQQWWARGSPEPEKRSGRAARP